VTTPPWRMTPDQRVRRALAGALAAVPASPRTDPARQQLAADPRFSVRSALYKAERSSAPRHRPLGEPA